jgi:hypothetical protein
MVQTAEFAQARIGNLVGLDQKGPELGKSPEMPQVLVGKRIPGSDLESLLSDCCLGWQRPRPGLLPGHFHPYVIASGTAADGSLSGD